MKPKPKKIRVDLLPEDFNDYSWSYRKLLTAALFRQLKVSRVWFNGTNIHTTSMVKPKYRFKIRDWNEEIFERVWECHNQGDKTIYYVELERV